MTDRERWKALLPIIQAYVDGEEIEMRLSPDDRWANCAGYTFQMQAEHYRIKPEPTYRPFASAEEFAPHRDRWFKVKRDQDGVTRFNDYDDRGVFTSTAVRQRWNELFENFVFDDGTPCGVLVQPDQNA